MDIFRAETEGERAGSNGRENAWEREEGMFLLASGADYSEWLFGFFPFKAAEEWSKLFLNLLKLKQGPELEIQDWSK